jgi:endonuclease YncB( thermonuclease family)
MKIATAVEVLDGASFRLRTDAIIIIDGLTVPEKGTEIGKKAKQKLEELVLKKKVEYETTTWDPMGRIRATVTVDGVDVRQAMEEYLKSL